MGSFEMYYNFIDEGDYKLSKIMQKCLIRDILDRIDQDESDVGGFSGYEENLQQLWLVGIV